MRGASNAAEAIGAHIQNFEGRCTKPTRSTTEAFPMSLDVLTVVQSGFVNMTIVEIFSVRDLNRA